MGKRSGGRNKKENWNGSVMGVKKDVKGGEGIIGGRSFLFWGFG